MHGAIDADMAACGLWLLALRRSGVEAWKPGKISAPPHPHFDIPLNAMPGVDAAIKVDEELSLLPGLQRTLGTRRTKATFQGRKPMEIS